MNLKSFPIKPSKVNKEFKYVLKIGLSILGKFFFLRLITTAVKIVLIAMYYSNVLMCVCAYVKDF